MRKPNKVTLDSLARKILAFNKARDWIPVAPDAAKSVVIEAAELLEKFQWDDSQKYIKDSEEKDWEEIGDEVADVFWYLVTFCDSSKIDFPIAVKRKLAKLELKYPAKMFNGKHNEKFYKEQKKKYRKMRGKS